MKNDLKVTPWRALTAVMTQTSESVQLEGYGTYDPLGVAKPRKEKYQGILPFPWLPSQSHTSFWTRNKSVLFDEWSRDPVVLAELWRNAQNIAKTAVAMRATPPKIRVVQESSRSVKVHVESGPSMATYLYFLDPLEMKAYSSGQADGVTLYWAFSQLIEEELRKFLRDPLTGPLRKLYDELMKQRMQQLERAGLTSNNERAIAELKGVRVYDGLLTELHKLFPRGEAPHLPCPRNLLDVVRDISEVPPRVTREHPVFTLY